MFSQSGVDALCSATYLQDFLDCVESLPDEIQRHVSEIRRLDSDYFDGVNQIRQLKENLVRYKTRPTEVQMNGTNEEGPSNHVTASELSKKRLVLLGQLKYLLLRSQGTADAKLAELSSISELIETKTRELEHDSKNMEMDLTGSGVSTKSATYGHGESSTSSERPVRSIMRGFMRGEKERFSNLGQTPLDDSQPSRSEKQALSVMSSGMAILTAMASEAESAESASPSTSSSANAFIDGGTGSSSTTRQISKRPRRQKQYPDFVRTELDTSASSLPPGNNSNGLNNNGATVTAIVSPAPVTSSARNSKEKSVGGSNVAQANKRKKKRQKPDTTTTTGGAGTAATAGKIKFNLPVDPDEPTYCLCEQVSYGEMIGCDNNDCDIEWFHFNCVGLTSKPKGKWYCPNCRGDRPNIMKQLSSKT